MWVLLRMINSADESSNTKDIPRSLYTEYPITTNLRLAWSCGRSMSLMGLSGLLVVGCGLRKSGMPRSMSLMGRLVVVVVVVVVVALGDIPMATMEQPLKSFLHSRSGFCLRFAHPMYIQMQSTEMASESQSLVTGLSKFYQ